MNTGGMFTTLKKIRAHSPCAEGWKKLLTSLDKTEADDEPLSFLFILESNGLDDALWCCRSAPEYDREWRLFAVWCARQVQHLMTDKRSLDAIDTAEKFANGEATISELNAAWGAAGAAAASLAASLAASWAASWAAAAAGASARASARAAQKTEFARIIGGVA